MVKKKLNCVQLGIIYIGLRQELEGGQIIRKGIIILKSLNFIYYFACIYGG